MPDIVSVARKVFKDFGADGSGLLALSIDAKDGSEVSNVLNEFKAINSILKAVISVNMVLTLKLVESINGMGLKIPE